MEYFTRAIVLNNTASREYDRLVSLYTHQVGKVSATARGARRLTSKMAGHLEPFGLIAVKLVAGRDRYTISNVETIQRYQRIVTDLSLMRLAKSCLRLVDDLVHEGACDIGILDGLAEVLSTLDNPAVSMADKQWLVNIFGLRLVTHLGYRPQLNVCVVCGRGIDQSKAQLDVLRGGLRCSSCMIATSELVVPLSAGAVAIFQQVGRGQTADDVALDRRVEVMAAIQALVRSVRGK